MSFRMMIYPSFAWFVNRSDECIIRKHPKSNLIFYNNKEALE
jgi:hypothetical protein